MSGVCSISGKVFGNYGLKFVLIIGKCIAGWLPACYFAFAFVFPFVSFHLMSTVFIFTRFRLTSCQVHPLYLLSFSIGNSSCWLAGCLLLLHLLSFFCSCHVISFQLLSPVMLLQEMKWISTCISCQIA